MRCLNRILLVLINWDEFNGVHEFKSWILQLREIFRSRILTVSYILAVGFFIHIFSKKKNVLYNFLTPKFGVSYFHTIHMVQQAIQYFTLKGVILFGVEVLIYLVNNQKTVERKNLYLIGTSYTYEFN
ncbi:hypothetical protein Hanom_Chr03g00226461 [Helianthus anomalus]